MSQEVQCMMGHERTRPRAPRDGHMERDLESEHSDCQYITRFLYGYSENRGAY